MKATVFVTLKPDVLDPQGRAIQRACETLGCQAVREVRQGKLFEIVLDAPDRPAAARVLQEICHKLLANPVIENARIERLEETDGVN